MIYIIGVVAFAYVLFLLYLAYCTSSFPFFRATCAATPLIVRAVCWSIYGAAFALDVAFNFTVATAIFLRLPNVRRPTFTQRCQKHINDDDYRGRIARWTRDSWLNPFEEGHL